MTAFCLGVFGGFVGYWMMAFAFGRIPIPRRRRTERVWTLTARGETAERLDWLTKSTGCKDMAEMTQKAYSLLQHVYTEHALGSSVVIRAHDGKETVVKLGGEGMV